MISSEIFPGEKPHRIFTDLPKILKDKNLQIKTKKPKTEQNKN